MIRNALVGRQLRRVRRVDFRVPLGRRPRRRTGARLVDAGALAGMFRVVDRSPWIQFHRVQRGLFPQTLVFGKDIAEAMKSFVN